jgi:hypothetical protein
MARHTFKLKGVDKALGRHDLAMDTVEGVLITLGVALDKAPNAARSHVHLVNRGRETFRPPPLRYGIWVRERPEHELARSVEDARHDDLQVRKHP